jgi:hypothetical protein
MYFCESLAVVNGVFGFCGIVCFNCPVFKATLENNEVERKKVAELLTKQYRQEYKPEDINCDSYVSDSGRIFSFCSVCGIKQCGRERRVKNCAYCAAYPCEKLDEVFNAYPRAKQMLDVTRWGVGTQPSF